MRIATFNCENLFARYRFRSSFDPRESDGFTINNLAFDIYDETEKQITAMAIREVNADVIALQEVENLPTLDRFTSRYLGGLNYRHRMVIDGNDQRGIDVAVLSRFPLTGVRSYRHERNPANTACLFSRDCLEVRADCNGKELTLYINHLKSMIGGRAATKGRREEQAKRVAGVIDERWRSSGYSGNFIVLGDLNDYPGAGSALDPLLGHEGMVNVLERLPLPEQWTHFYAGGNEYRQLDYLLLSRSLAEHNAAPPEVMRKGLPFRAERYEGERLPHVGENDPKASDHAPLYMDIELF
ncbi:MAG: endonuclease/exonuclease/phosphatase [Desulfobulbaceae bacterium]|nr:MAG: endonuclease/exonuclease/phosphatase [Desulfobulbaceae bacterium]